MKQKTAPEIFIYDGIERRKVFSLEPFLINSLQDGIFMDLDVMKEEDIRTCLWLGFGIGKGITDPIKNLSVFGEANRIYRGLHYELVKEFPDIDPFPLCYDEEKHVKGFGRFVRWVYFADPKREQDFLGIDFSLVCRPTSGVANSVTKVADVVKVIFEHGVSLKSEVVLLNRKMCEHSGITEMRRQAGLITVNDWINLADKLFLSKSPFCSKCGLKTFDKPVSFCYRCGYRLEQKGEISNVERS